MVGNEVKELRVRCWVNVHMLTVNKKTGIKRKAVTFVNLPGCGHAKGKFGKMESDSMHFKGDVVLRELGKGMILEILMRNGQPFAPAPTSRLVVCQLWKQKQESCRANCFL